MSVHLTTQKIIKDWTDYNNHMNVAYYVLIFDIYGAEKLMNIFKMGEQSAKSTKKSSYKTTSAVLDAAAKQMGVEIVEVTSKTASAVHKALRSKGTLTKLTSGRLRSTFVYDFLSCVAGTDVMLIVKDQRLAAHRALLMVRSQAVLSLSTCAAKLIRC